MVSRLSGEGVFAGHRLGSRRDAAGVMKPRQTIDAAVAISFGHTRWVPVWLLRTG